MRIHPDFNYQTKARSHKHFHDRCENERLLCPFEDHKENDLCKTCSWKRRGE